MKTYYSSETKGLEIGGIRPSLEGSENNRVPIFPLRGSSKDRRKQSREIYKRYSDHRIEKHGWITLKHIDGTPVEVEEANKPQTLLRVYLYSDDLPDLK